jgi:hypothetical protein
MEEPARHDCATGSRRPARFAFLLERLAPAVLRSFPLYISRSLDPVNRIVRSAAAAAFLAAACSVSAAPTFGETVGLLPRDSQVVFAFNVQAEEDQQSLISYIPLKELGELAKKSIAEKKAAGTPLEAGDAIMQLYLDGTLGKTSVIAIGGDLDPASTSIPTVIMGGQYADPTTAMTNAGAKATDVEKLMELTTTQGPVFASSGLPNFLVAGSTKESVLKVKEGIDAKTNLTAAGSKFNDLAQALAGRSPDAIIFVPGAALREQTAALNAGTRTMLAPLLKTEGMLLSGMPGTPPTAELHLAFPTEGDAQIGVAYLNNLVMMGKGELTPILEQAKAANAPADQVAQVQQMMDMLNSLQVGAKGKSVSAVLPLKDLPPREETRKEMLESMQQSIESVLSGQMPTM